jgi:hypothetical protein
MSDSMKMNLRVIQRIDSSAISIKQVASHVAMYSFSVESQEWVKLDIDGPLFLYEKSVSPFYGCIVLNRLGLTNFSTFINSNQILTSMDNYLMYRDTQDPSLSTIYGFWFHDSSERDRISDAWKEFMNSGSKSNGLDLLFQQALSKCPTSPSQVSHDYNLETISKLFLSTLSDSGFISKSDFIQLFINHLQTDDLDQGSPADLFINKLYGMYLQTL